MSPKSAQRFWGNDMHKQGNMSPKSAQRFWGNDMHNINRAHEMRPALPRTSTPAIRTEILPCPMRVTKASPFRF
ncbi:hypothetical protein EMEDMD4_440065 [Sinorhizobium medicae]|uniref:Uncharacterized protein n=1 Tax=Sinorhizobium medicae TaxID=110321 RepID=A0A508X1C9_9HYPH|nr:hypothetical protein EMEDMD4_440065 [Sinorhizobium medicae]